MGFWEGLQQRDKQLEELAREIAFSGRKELEYQAQPGVDYPASLFDWWLGKKGLHTGEAYKRTGTEQKFQDQFNLLSTIVPRLGGRVRGRRAEGTPEGNLPIPTPAQAVSQPIPTQPTLTQSILAPDYGEYLDETNHELNAEIDQLAQAALPEAETPTATLAKPKELLVDQDQPRYYSILTESLEKLVEQGDKPLPWNLLRKKLAKGKIGPAVRPSELDWTGLTKLTGGRSAEGLHLITPSEMLKEIRPIQVGVERSGPRWNKTAPFNQGDNLREIHVQLKNAGVVYDSEHTEFKNILGTLRVSEYPVLGEGGSNMLLAHQVQGDWYRDGAQFGYKEETRASLVPWTPYSVSAPALEGTKRMSTAVQKPTLKLLLKNLIWEAAADPKITHVGWKTGEQVQMDWNTAPAEVYNEDLINILNEIEKEEKLNFNLRTGSNMLEIRTDKWKGAPVFGFRITPEIRKQITTKGFRISQREDPLTKFAFA